MLCSVPSICQSIFKHTVGIISRIYLTTMCEYKKNIKTIRNMFSKKCCDTEHITYEALEHTSLSNIVQMPSVCKNQAVLKSSLVHNTPVSLELCCGHVQRRRAGVTFVLSIRRAAALLQGWGLSKWPHPCYHHCLLQTPPRYRSRT